jgi:elongation factor Ts
MMRPRGVLRPPETRHTLTSVKDLKMATTTAITAKHVQELRQKSGAGMMDAKRALEEAGGDMQKAGELLRAKGIAKAEKRSDRTASEGRVGSYIHHNGKVGVLVEVNSETDFVSNTDGFKELVREIALHIASAAPLAVDRDGIPAAEVERERRIAEQQFAESGKPESLREKIVQGKVDSFYKQHTLMSQEYVRDNKKTIGDLVKELSAKVGENIVVKRFARFQLGQE